MATFRDNNQRTHSGTARRMMWILNFTHRFRLLSVNCTPVRGTKQVPSDINVQFTVFLSLRQGLVGYPAEV